MVEIDRLRQYWPFCICAQKQNIFRIISFYIVQWTLLLDIKGAHLSVKQFSAVKQFNLGLWVVSYKFTENLSNTEAFCDFYYIHFWTMKNGLHVFFQ